jgi:hypothetical protein
VSVGEIVERDGFVFADLTVGQTPRSAADALVGPTGLSKC